MKLIVPSCGRCHVHENFSSRRPLVESRRVRQLARNFLFVLFFESLFVCCAISHHSSTFIIFMVYYSITIISGVRAKPTQSTFSGNSFIRLLHLHCEQCTVYTVHAHRGSTIKAKPQRKIEINFIPGIKVSICTLKNDCKSITLSAQLGWNKAGKKHQKHQQQPAATRAHTQTKLETWLNYC